MAVTAAVPRPGEEAAAPSAQQVYYTHCLPADSIGQQSGYSVRAASTADRALFQFANDYPAYELPPDLWTSVGAPAQAPRRLALVPAPQAGGGGCALIHSAYLPEDTRGRKNSFFTHYLFLPALDPLRALQTWASPDWTVSYPQGASKQLLPAPVPRPGPLTDAVLADFLSPREPSTEPWLATALVPPRLPPEPARRRALLRLALSGYLLARKGEGSPRGRLYLVAEPGLAALLCYAFVRLLPPALTADLTFSTYENAHRALRAYQAARVVATYFANPQKGLEKDYFGLRGYALDTFSGAASPELEAEAPPTLDELIDLAARGDWEALDATHRLLGASNVSVSAFAEGRQVLQARRRVESGDVSADDLVRLHRSPYGVHVLEQCQHVVWPVVRDQALSNEALRHEFADLLRARLPEIQQGALMALAGNLADWPLRWELIAWLHRRDPARIKKAFLELVTALGPRAAGLRLKLLKGWQALDAEELPAPLLALLQGGTATDLEQLSRAGLPEDWAIEALDAGLRRRETQPTAVRLLCDGDEGLLPAFWETLGQSKPDEQAAFLKLLMPAADARGRATLVRMLTKGCAIKPAALDKFFQAREAYGEKWDDFWLRQRMLFPLLHVLQPFGKVAAVIWEGFCDRIDRRLLVEGNAGQKALLEGLANAARRAAGAPSHVQEALQDWALLQHHFAQPPQEDDHWEQAQEACLRRGMKPEELLQAYFLHHHAALPPDRDRLDSFLAAFHAFYAPGDDERQHRERLLSWLKIVDGCKDLPQQALYQRAYLESAVPLKVRKALVNEYARRLDPSVVEALSGDQEAPGFEMVEDDEHGEDQGNEGGATDEDAGDALMEGELQDTSELEARAADALENSPDEWPNVWSELKRALSGNKEALRDVFLNAVKKAYPPAPGISVPMLLQEWSALGTTELVAPLDRLAEQVSLKDLGRVRLPAEWKAKRLLTALNDPRTLQEATRFLDAGGVPLARAFWALLSGLALYEQEKYLDLLMPPNGPERAARLGGLLASGVALSPAMLEGLLRSLGVFEEKWEDFWGRDDNLSKLLLILGPSGERGGPIWVELVDWLGLGALEGRAKRKGLFEALKASADRLGGAVPAKAREAIRDWTFLCRQFKWPLDANTSWGDLLAAGQRRGRAPQPLLQSFFLQIIVPRASNPEVLETFIEGLLDRFPKGDDYAAEKKRLNNWLAVVVACTDLPARTKYQVYYLEHYVRDAAIRQALAGDVAIQLTPETRRAVTSKVDTARS